MPAKIRSGNPFCVLCLGSSQAVITGDLVNGENMQSDRRFSSCGSGACQADSKLSAAEQPLHCHPLPQPALPSSGSWQPTLPAQCPGHLAQTHLLLPAPPTRSLTRLGLKGPAIPLFSVVYLFEIFNSHRSETIATWDLFHFIFITTDIYI